MLLAAVILLALALLGFETALALRAGGLLPRTVPVAGALVALLGLALALLLV